MPTADDITSLRALVDQLDTDAKSDAATLADALARLKAAQDQLSASQAENTADDATIATLNAKVAQLEAQLQPPAPIAGVSRLAWSDEFNGSAVDGTKWNIRNGWVGGNESSICWARNVSVANGNLVIQPKRETTTSGSTTRQFTSGYLDTSGKLAISKPSYTEFRAKLPLKQGYSRGMWPAFWFRLKVGTLEIDLMEAWGTPSDKADTSGHFQFSVWPNTNSATNGYHGWAVSAQDLTAWHAYGLKLDADGTATCYYDGKPCSFTMQGATYSKVTPAQIPGLGWDQKADQLEIRLNLQVGQPSYYGNPDSNTDFSQQMLVDYVRVWTP